MRSIALALIVSLFGSVARADDTPRMDPVSTGYIFTTSGWALNDAGKARLDAVLTEWTAEIEKLHAENAALKVDLTAMAAKPTLTWKGAALFIGIGLVVGAGTAATVALARR